MNTSDDEVTNRSSSDQAGAHSADTQRTDILAGVDDTPSDRDRDATRWHGGLDFGLLILRVVLGGTMFAHGLQKLFGAFDGPGIGGFAQALSGPFGYSGNTTLLSWITALSETLGGLLLVLGLFTPLGAAAILGVAANVVYVKWANGFFMGNNGFEYELLIGTVALALLFTGAGRISVDKNTPWRRRPMPFALLGLLLAAAASVVVLVVFR